jgi:hypothetical protein
MLKKKKLKYANLHPALIKLDYEDYTFSVHLPFDILIVISMAEVTQTFTFVNSTIKYN